MFLKEVQMLLVTNSNYLPGSDGCYIIGMGPWAVEESSCVHGLPLQVERTIFATSHRDRFGHYLNLTFSPHLQAGSGWPISVGYNVVCNWHRKLGPLNWTRLNFFFFFFNYVWLGFSNVGLVSLQMISIMRVRSNGLQLTFVINKEQTGLMSSILCDKL